MINEYLFICNFFYRPKHRYIGHNSAKIMEFGHFLAELIEKWPNYWYIWSQRGEVGLWSLGIKNCVYCTS